MKWKRRLGRCSHWRLASSRYTALHRRTSQVAYEIKRWAVRPLSSRQKISDSQSVPRRTSGHRLVMRRSGSDLLRKQFLRRPQSGRANPSMCPPILRIILSSGGETGALQPAFRTEALPAARDPLAALSTRSLARPYSTRMPDGWRTVRLYRQSTPDT